MEETSSSSTSTLAVSASGGVKTATFYGWKYSHYFKVVEEGERNLRVRCTLCAPSSQKTLSSARNTTSNFKKHLDTVHKATKLVGKEPAKGKRSRESTGADNDEPPTPAKRQRTLLSQATISPVKLRSLMSEYIVEDMLPLSTVDSPAFRKLFEGVYSMQIPGRKALTTHLDNVFASMEPKLKESLKEIEFVCTTADVWKACNKGFFGMTIHWINPTTLQRCKAAISCSRLIGRNTYDVLAGRIESIHRHFEICPKVTATITDNGSNFVKAFKVFTADPSPSSASEEVIEQQDDDQLQSEENEEVSFEDMSDALTLESENDDDYTQVEYELPSHERCAAHTLNLVASSDVEKSLSSSSLSKQIFRSSFAKCTVLWNKASRSTVASDHVEATLKRKLTVPSSTRWNSYYDAVSRITENSLEELNTLCTRLELRRFTEKELTFLKEYCKVLYPLVRGLDILQGEENCYYGTLLPTLVTILRKTKAIKTQLSTMTTGMAFSVEDAIKRRFEKVLDSKVAIISAITLPKFKLKWVELQATKDHYTQMLIDEMCLYADTDCEEREDVDDSQKDNTKRDFYEFDSDEESTACDSVELEAARYLSDAKTLECLHNYPTIKKLFLKYNTTLPSSAPVERLFSMGNLVLTPKRNRLTNTRFEKLLLLRYNKHFIEL